MKIENPRRTVLGRTVARLQAFSLTQWHNGLVGMTGVVCSVQSPCAVQPRWRGRPGLVSGRHVAGEAARAPSGWRNTPDKVAVAVVGAHQCDGLMERCDEGDSTVRSEEVGSQTCSTGEPRGREGMGQSA
jgi:hypothetical protein